MSFCCNLCIIALVWIDFNLSGRREGAMKLVHGQWRFQKKLVGGGGMKIFLGWESFAYR